MNHLYERQLRFYIRLSYPVAVTARGAGYVGVFPDLPGCESYHTELEALHFELEGLRQRWIREHLRFGCVVPLPNSHLDGATKPDFTAISPYSEAETP